MSDQSIEQSYQQALERYADFGVDTDAALKSLSSTSISLQCWQGDDVSGFETPDAELGGGGIAVTGNYPGKARTIDELRRDLAEAYSLIPGKHRLNLHSSYGDFGDRRIDRDQFAPEHFQTWVDWARENDLALDFNATLFSHAKADSGFTLASMDKGIRSFWIEHVKRCREIAAWMGEKLGNPCIHNLWIPDGAKDETVSRMKHREHLHSSLEEIYGVRHASEHLKDSVECKLFGIGSESFVVGSHEFYLLWALQKGVMVCLDMGHFHPTESVADKLSALLVFFDEILLHVSRGVRWDSDHVVTLNDELRALMLEITRARALNRVHIALDFFDASINRVGAWVIGTRATQKALLYALLEPTEKLRDMEAKGDLFGRLALMEEMKIMPLGAVWDYHCLTHGVPGASDWMRKIYDYEDRVLKARV